MPIRKGDYWNSQRWKEKAKWMLILAYNPSHQAGGHRMVNSNSKQCGSIYLPCYILFCIQAIFFHYIWQNRFSQWTEIFSSFLGDTSEPSMSFKACIPFMLSSNIFPAPFFLHCFLHTEETYQLVPPWTDRKLCGCLPVCVNEIKCKIWILFCRKGTLLLGCLCCTAAYLWEFDIIKSFKCCVCVVSCSYVTWLSWTCGTSRSSTMRRWWRWWENVTTSAPSISASTGASMTGKSEKVYS